MAHSSTSASPTAEAPAFLRTAAIAHPSVSVVEATGDDRLRWLNGMVSNTIEGLAPGTLDYNFILNAQGRIQGDLYAWRSTTTEGDRLYLEMETRQQDTLLAHLDRYIIMDDVELRPAPIATALDVIGPDAEALLTKEGIPVPAEPLSFTRLDYHGTPIVIARHHGTVPRLRIYAAEEVLEHLASQLQLPTMTATELEALRIYEGTPTYGTDITERELPQETSQQRALHFNKGCYLGQEIVERIRSRGNVHRHLRRLSLSAPATVGTKLLLNDTENGAEVGTITSSAEIPGLGAFAIAMLNAQGETATELSYSGGVAQLL